MRAFMIPRGPRPSHTVGAIFLTLILSGGVLAYTGFHTTEAAASDAIVSEAVASAVTAAEVLELAGSPTCEGLCGLQLTTDIRACVASVERFRTCFLLAVDDFRMCTSQC